MVDTADASDDTAEAADVGGDVVDVPLYFVPTGCTDLSDSVGGAVSAQTGLQRIVSRCRCDFYYLSYDEDELPDDRIKVVFDKTEEDEKTAAALFEVSRG